LTVRARKAIPWAYILAYVAAKYPIVEFIPRFLRNFFPELNGVVGNAPTPVYNIRLWNRIGRTRVHTCRACAAVIFRRGVIFQVKVDNEFGKEEEASHGAVQQQRILASPSESRTGRPRSFHYRCGINKCP